MNKLVTLKKGEKGKIAYLELLGRVKQKFSAMGLTSGAVVTMKGIAPLGDPLLFEVRDVLFALRKSEADKIYLM